MRDSLADLEKLLVTMSKEIEEDRNFLGHLLDHKNDTIRWLRERQKEEHDVVNAMYDGLVEAVMKEITLIETHIKVSYERNQKDETNLTR